MNRNQVKIYTKVHDIERWKTKMLNHVVDAFASTNQASIQKSISTWLWSNKLPFPSAEHISINGGCLTFETLVAEHIVFFSLWYTLWEVRVGVRVPNELMGTGGSMINQLSLAYDGTPCQKITDTPEGQFIDWIFRDTGTGFASFSTGFEATQNTLMELALASKLADILIHIYMATMNQLINAHDLKVTHKKIVRRKRALYAMVDVRGDTESFELHAERQGWEIEEHKPLSSGENHYTLSTDDTKSRIQVGDGCIDESWYSVLRARYSTSLEGTKEHR
ncbi:MAG: hypothetical protein ACXWTX_02425 [Gallionella sp.]